jgi:ubiquinone/menaquinone biosynthesis C-methylase UbiE
MGESTGLFSGLFLRLGKRMDDRGARESRRELVASAVGSVVEIGAGYGATFELYGDRVTSVLALEPDAALRAAASEAARTAATRSGIPITVVEGVGEAIPVPDSSVDTVVSSLVLCSVGSQAEVLAEIRRVLKPGGRFLFYEHVRSTNRMLAALEDAATPLWSRLAGGCHPNRDTVAAIEASGFRVEQSRTFGFSVLAGIPPVDHVIGIAVNGSRGNG